MVTTICGMSGNGSDHAALGASPYKEKREIRTEAEALKAIQRIPNIGRGAGLQAKQRPTPAGSTESRIGV
jgi:hypothetical protein